MTKYVILFLDIFVWGRNKLFSDKGIRWSSTINGEWRPDMKKAFWSYEKIYILLVAVLLIGALCFSSMRGDVKQSTTRIAEENLASNAEIFAAYFDDMIEGSLNQLKQLGKAVNVSIYEDTSATRELLKGYRPLFSSLSILTVQGTQEYGDHITLKLDQAGMLQTLVYDKKPIVYSDMLYDQFDNAAVLLAVPIEVSGKVTGIVVGTVTIDDLNELMDQWGYSQKGCAFLISSKGNYVTKGKKFNEILGGKANNFFTYLGNGDLTGDISSVSDIEHKVQRDDTFTFHHEYSGSDYLMALHPSEYGNWYFGFAEGAEEIKSSGLTMGVGTKLYFAVFAAFGILFLVVIVLLNHRDKLNCDALERYTILDSMDKSVVFEFQFEPKRFRMFGDTMEMFGQEVSTLRGEEVYDVYQYVHEDDRSVRGRIHRFYDDESRQFMSEIRIKNLADGNYGWFRVSGILVKDTRLGTNQKFLGKIESADQQIAEEKDLVQRAENDLLTGVLNKKTMEEKVTKCLQHIEGHTHYIFFMVDLDNFKNVNDKLGHIYGDNAIVDTANKLTEIFSNNAYVGRLGGDEFAVCASYDAFDDESLLSYIKKKAEQICEANRRTYTNGGVSINISSSVGIAIAPDFGQDFETIYKMADSALYRSKNGGKNCFHIYKKER